MPFIVTVSEEKDLLYVTDRMVSILSLPDLQVQGSFGQGFIGIGESNMDLQEHQRPNRHLR
jgi:hypothetical protein